MHTTSDSPLALYRKMGDISDRMVTAAHAGEWEQLVVLEQSMAECRHALEGQDLASLANEERAEGATLIRHILENQANVEEYIRPWMDHIHQLLGDSTARRKIAHAYGVD